MSVTAKITAKGQLTLPRIAREALGTNTVEIEIVGGKVLISPVRSVAGTLARYAAGDEPLKKIRVKVWQEVADAGKG